MSFPEPEPDSAKTIQKTFDEMMLEHGGAPAKKRRDKKRSNIAVLAHSSSLPAGTRLDTGTATSVPRPKPKKNLLCVHNLASTVHLIHHDCVPLSLQIP